MPGTFRQGRSPVEKPGRPSRTCRAKSSASAKRGALSFGYFSLAKQRKVTRPPAGGRKPAAGEHANGNATTERNHFSLVRGASCPRKDDEQKTARHRDGGNAPLRRGEGAEKHACGQRRPPIADMAIADQPASHCRTIPPHSFERPEHVVR